MKKIAVFILFLSSLQSIAQIDPQGIIVLSDTFCFSNNKPMPFISGSKVSILCDTVYIINKHRYVLYEKSADIIREKKYVNTCNVLIQNYEERIQAQNKAFDNLYSKYIRLDSISQTTINDTRNSLINVSNTITSAQNNIVVVDKKMDELTNTIKTQKKQSFYDKLLYGFGGIAVGVLGGLIIAH